MPDWLSEFLPILILLVVVTLLINRLPKVDIGHSDAFRRRRVLNWLPLGLTYAFLYMGRYNLKISKFAFEGMTIPGETGALMGNDDFGYIFGVGTVVYGFSFVINGPLTDRIGGRKAILIGAAGAAVANVLMGIVSMFILEGSGDRFELLARNLTPIFSVLYAANMYFQSFGAVAIVKVNASWFHVRERGVFGGIFGILISLGIYFAYDWGYKIVNAGRPEDGSAYDYPGLTWVFFTPAILLAIFWILDVLYVRDTPGEAGQQDFDTADASSGDDGPRLSAGKIFGMMLRNPIIMTIAAIEFCSGFLRQAIMQWYRTFAKQTDGELGLVSDFVYENWGMLLCVAGISGGVVAGIISDRVFHSRRGPVAALLYGVMLVGSVILCFVYDTPVVGWLVVVMSMAVIGVHGMLSGTASMDFGGRKNVGTAVGIIDGFVYLGTAVMSFTYAMVLPKEQFEPVIDPATGQPVVDAITGETKEALVGPVTDPDNWMNWPLAMVPISAVGLFFAWKIWHAQTDAMKQQRAQG